MIIKHQSLKCPHGTCKAKINPSNAATNFANPALSVKVSVDREIIRTGQKILEFGSGNLRNSLFILNSVRDVKVYAYDLQETINRFPENYKRFEKLGGVLVGEDYKEKKYDIVICTFVLETICPEQRRFMILSAIKSVVKRSGLLIASFRGYPGVRGNRHRECLMGEGLITPKDTFVRPYSISEVKNLMCQCGFKAVQTLQKYRVEEPENVHILASLERER